MFCSKFGGECSHKVIPDDKFVFVMMPFANSDSIYDAIKHAVEAIKNKHLKCERADSRYTSRSIWCGRICNNIRKAKYIIVDTTHRNPNVFYELGFAHAMISDTKTIIITQNIKEAPFDVKDLGHIIYSEKNLPRLREDLKKIILDLEQEEKNESYENKPPDKVISDLKSQLQAEEERGSKFKKELIETEERERKLKEHIKEIEASQFTSPEVAKNKITELKGNVAELQSKLIFTEKDKKDVVEQLKKNLYEKENKLKLFEEHFKIYEKSKDIKPLSDWLFGNSRRRAEAEKWFNRAYDEAEKGNIEEAIKYYYAVIMLNPEYAVAHNNLGNLLQNLKRFEEAEKEFKEAIRLNPNDAVAHNNLGILLKNLKRFEEAEKEYKGIVTK